MTQIFFQIQKLFSAAFGLSRILSLLGLGLFLMTHSEAQGQMLNRPNINWEILRSPKVDIIYDAKNRELANHYALRIQSAIQKTGPLFSDHPEKLLIVLNDNTDLSNGYATPFPYAHSVLFPVPPTSFESIGEYGDWEEELVIHEYTHILSFEPQSGLMKVLRGIFGSVISPQILLPRWWLEGLAVELETRLSQHGRLRSTQQDAIARALVLEDQLQKITLAEINETSIPSFPYGGRPYIFGSWLWSYMIHEPKSPELIEALTQAHGRSLPYLLDGQAKKHTQKTYSQIFEETKSDLQSRVKEQLLKIRNLPPSQGEALGYGQIETWLPSMSPDGLKMALLSRDSTLKRSIKILVRPNLEERFNEKHELALVTEKESLGETSTNPLPDGPPTGSISRLIWTPDSVGFYYDLVSERDPYSLVSDLWFYDLKSQKSQQVTQGLRAREPGLSPDGQSLAFIALEPARTGLVVMNLPSRRLERALIPPLGVRLSSPTFIAPDELVLIWHQDGLGRLVKYHTGTRSYEFLTGFDFPFQELSNSADGLLALSPANGINNLYWISKDLQEIKALTHTLTATAIGALDNRQKKLYAPELSAQGWRVKIFELQAKSLKELPSISPLLADRYPTQPRLPISEIKIQDSIVGQRPLDQTDTQGPRAFEIKNELSTLEEFSELPYSGLSYLKPHYWYPTSIGSTGDRTYFSATTGSFDPVQHHSYSLSLGYEFNFKDYFLQANYLNQKSTWPWLLALFSEQRNSDGLQDSRQRWIALLSAQKYTWNWVKDSQLEFGLEAEESSLSQTAFRKTGLSLAWTRDPLASSGTMISPESGLLFKTQIKHHLSGEGRIGYNQLYLLAQKHQRFSWMPRHHSWMLRTQAQWVPERIPFSEYEGSSSFNFYQSPLITNWLFRGLIGEAIVGKSLANLNLEYRFPLKYAYDGFGLTPLFINRYHGALTVDGIQVDGFGSQNALTYQRRDLWESLWSIGLELKADITLGYHFPLTFTLGAYQVLDPRYKASAQSIGLGLQL